MGHGNLSLSIDQISVGATCSQPIVSDAGVLLVAANTRITQQVITGLRERQIESISVDPRDLGVLSREAKPAQTPKHDRTKPDGHWDPLRPVKDQLVDRHGERLSAQRSAQLDLNVSTAKKAMDKFETLLLTEPIRSVADFAELFESYIDLMVDDLDQTVGAMALKMAVDEASERSLKIAVLGMSVACELGLCGTQVLEVGMVGLLHDAGLRVMDPELLKPLELLTEQQRWEYQKHPLVSGKFVAGVTGVPPNVKMAIEQVHEQFNGSGFPRGVKAQRIHLYARILNVVDAYLQLISANSLRSGILQHDALGLLLYQASRGLFDPQVIRAFLNVESLFPLGSHVELSTGQLAKVIRRPKVGFALPVVETSEGERVDLESSKTQVVRPMSVGNEEPTRLTQEMMESCDWNPASASILV
ncbi:HD-GYP domain-containing protein [Rubripirellula reticaptiva]|uniref:Cyclic di-GMP phosphodiesterase response regulator RpfG n=1 Tax=Rubripirellula reticaptiva TaxID=2528013 RepID=A0A5C6ESK7_9BACT|nr:HD domain-containing phosphohydrolase [Rubripirellula reticaptiva]TWU51310.1 Cyclic di-GMP phosphodiesterase response regulator RpfG [Rubripirellula reticaptiva]